MLWNYTDVWQASSGLFGEWMGYMSSYVPWTPQYNNEGFFERMAICHWSINIQLKFIV